MQTLFHRVAQVRATCRCPQCLHTAHGLSRRAAASATRRMPRYAISSTFWYSATFAIAASFDAVNKAQRSEKWDRAIADVKKELAQPMVQHKQEELQVTDEEQELGALEEVDEVPTEDERLWRAEADERAEEVAQEAAQTIAGPESTTPQLANAVPRKTENSIDIFAGDDALQELERNLDSSRRRRHIPRWPVSTQPDLVQYNLPPQSIYASDWYKEKADLTRWPPGKMARVSIATEQMLVRFQYRAVELDSTGERCANLIAPTFAHLLDSPESMSSPQSKFRLTVKSLDEDILNLRATLKEKGEGALDDDYHRISTPLTNYHQDDAGDFRDAAYEMNLSVQQLFKDCENGRIPLSTMLSKTVYRIATSTAPPNLDTFNTLIVGCTKLRKQFRGQSESQDTALYYLTQASIRGCIQARMRPNEVTIAAILDWYTSEGMIGQFRRYVERMRGQHNGLMFAKHSINVTDAGRSRLVVPEDDEQDFNWRKVVQLPYPTPMVFGALIKGVLKFSGFNAALDVCQAMAHEGWGLCMSGLNPLLLNCVARRDWSSGLAVWNQVRALHEKGRRRARREEPVPLSVFATMLRLCTRCSQRDAFEGVMQEASAVYPRALQNLLDLVKQEREAAPVSDWPELVPPTMISAQPGIGMAHDDSDRQPDGFDAPVDWSLKNEDINSVAPEKKAFGSVSWAEVDHEPTLPHNETPDGIQPPEHRTVHQREEQSSGFQPFTEEELHGHVPASEHLEEYERRERPMTMNG